MTCIQDYSLRYYLNASVCACVCVCARAGGHKGMISHIFFYDRREIKGNTMKCHNGYFRTVLILLCLLNLRNFLLNVKVGIKQNASKNSLGRSKLKENHWICKPNI